VLSHLYTPGGGTVLSRGLRSVVAFSLLVEFTVTLSDLVLDHFVSVTLINWRSPIMSMMLCWCR